MERKMTVNEPKRRGLRVVGFSACGSLLALWAATCVSVFPHVCAGSHVCAWRPEDNIKCISSEAAHILLIIYYLFIDAESLTCLNSPKRLVGWADKDPSVCLPILGCTTKAASFYMHSTAFFWESCGAFLIKCTFVLWGLHSNIKETI